MAETATLAQALHAFQGDAPTLQRDKINPHLGSKYLSLEALLEEVLPLLHKHGLAISQWPEIITPDTGAPFPVLRTLLVHAASGEQWNGVMGIFPTKPAPQEQGAALTYAKRYSLMAALGLSADSDTDGAAKPGSRQRSAPGKITAKQRTDLMTAIREAGITTDRAQEIVKEIAEVESSADIPTAKFRDVVKAIKAAA